MMMNKIIAKFDIFAFPPLFSYKGIYRYSSKVGVMFSASFYVFASIIAFFVAEDIWKKKLP